MNTDVPPSDLTKIIPKALIQMTDKVSKYFDYSLFLIPISSFWGEHPVHFLKVKHVQLI